MRQTKKTWRERWNGFWAREGQAGFPFLFNLLGASAYVAAMTLFVPKPIIFGSALFLLLVVNLWFYRFKYWQSVSAFVLGLCFVSVALPGRSPFSANDYSFENGILLAAFIVALCSVIFQTRVPIPGHVHSALKTLAVGTVACFAFALVLSLVQTKIGEWGMLLVRVSMYGLLLHGMQRASGLPETLVTSNRQRQPTQHNLEIASL